MLDAETQGLVAGVREGGVVARAMLADLLLERADAHLIAEVLVEVRREPGSTLLRTIPERYVMSGTLRKFFRHDFAMYMLCNRNIQPLPFIEAMKESATLTDLCAFEGRQLLRLNGGVDGVGRATLQKLKAVLALMGWGLKEGPKRKKKQKT